MRCGGNCKSERGSTAGRLRDRDVPSVRVRDLSHKRQTDAVARAIPAAVWASAMRKAVEQRFDGAWVDANTVVAHIDEDVVMVSPEGDRNRSAAVLVREGIVDEGGNRPAKRGTRPEYDETSYGCQWFLLFAGCCAVTVCGALVWRLHANYTEYAGTRTSGRP